MRNVSISVSKSDICCLVRHNLSSVIRHLVPDSLQHKEPLATDCIVVWSVPDSLQHKEPLAFDCGTIKSVPDRRFVKS